MCYWYINLDQASNSSIPILQSCTRLFSVVFLFDVKFVEAFHIEYGSKNLFFNHYMGIVGCRFVGVAC